jgi:flagellar motor switch protein FliM
MYNPKNVKKFDITRGEKVVHGQFAGLENIFNKFVPHLESYLFDEFTLPFEVDYEMDANMKFRDHLNSIPEPSPIFLFQQDPLKGDCMMVFENRLVNLLLAKKTLIKEKKVKVNNSFQVKDKNYSVIKDFASHILGKLDFHWSKTYPVSYHLEKLVSYRIKAKIMNAFEPCVVIKMNFRYKGLSTYIQFCFSSIQLDPIRSVVARSNFLADEEFSEEYPENKGHFDQVLDETSYEVKGVLGAFQLSRKELLENFQTGKIFPIEQLEEDTAVIEVNDVPLLTGVMGAMEEHYSLQVSDTYEQMVEKKRKEQKKVFRQLQFPKG